MDVKNDKNIKTGDSLLAVAWKKSNVDLFDNVLMVGECPTYAYRGCMFAKNLLVVHHGGVQDQVIPVKRAHILD